MGVRISLLLGALLLAAPSLAATRNCTTALVTGGICRASTNKLVSYDLPTSAASELADAVSAIGGCLEVTATTCSTTCTASLIAGGACTAGQLNTTVTITKATFSDATVRQMIVSLVRQYREDQAVSPARATARATTDPDISN